MYEMYDTGGDWLFSAAPFLSQLYLSSFYRLLCLHSLTV